MRSDISEFVTRPARTDKHSAIPALVLCALVALLTGCGTTGIRVKDTTRTFDTVVIDAGHGGHDDGARSRWGGKEKNHNLSVAKRLEPKLRAAGFKTVMTRRSDVFIPLNDRARISNRQNNAVFVSVHFNHSPKRKVRGSEVYYSSKVSRGMAQNILNQIGEIRGCSCRFIKTANFRVLKMNQYPAVLVECGYLSNRGEGSLCASPKHQEKLADAIATALIRQRGPLAPPKKAEPEPAPTPAPEAPVPAPAT